MPRFVELLVVLVACGGSGNPKPDPETATQQKVTAALARVEAIQPRLAKLRGLPFRRPVPTAQQTTADFKAFLHREIEREMPRDKSAKLSAAYLHIGLLEKQVDLATASEQTMASQAAAYYDPRAKKFFVVMKLDNDMMLDTMSAHELTHALQDQAFDLEKYVSPKPALDDDAQIARQFVVEGDATVAMYAYGIAEASGVADISKLIPMLQPQLEQLANIDLATYATMMKQQSAMMELDADLKRSMDSIGEAPAMIIWPMLDSYSKGALVVLTALQHGGWAAVDALYKEPPESSEQVLHPATKLFPKRERPTRVTVPTLDGELLVSNVLGELQWRTYFSLWQPGSAKASEGWAGDRFSVVKRPDGSLLGFHATIWDTVADAKEFADAYAASFTKRGDRKHAMTTDGTKVFILDGSDDAALLARLSKDTTFN